MKANPIVWVSMALVVLLLTVTPAKAAVPLTISYQGQLTDADGLPVADGNYAMTFAIYETASGGTALWSEAQTVSVAGGVYNVILGQPGNQLDPADLDGEHCLGVTVGSDDEMTPRQPITATAFALRAALANDADTLDGLEAIDFAASLHVHSAAEITSGTLSTGYYSAVSDLGAEGYLGNASGDIAQNNGARQVNLNADLLDGLSSSAFMSASADNWVDELGDTMTGALSVPYLQINGVTAFVADGSNNTLLGFGAGIYNTGGYHNTFLGHSAGQSNSTGFNNTFVGFLAGTSNTNGTSNTFVGYRAGYTTTGNYNTFLGTYSGRSNTTGYFNTFVGDSSGNSNTEGSENTFLGRTSGYHNTNGSNNTFVGNNAGQNNTEGGNNTIVGKDAGYSNTTGSWNAFIGHNAGRLNTTGLDNTFLGSQTGAFNTEGFANTFVGHGAGQLSETGYHNTFVGQFAGNDNTTGYYNTCLGSHAGDSNSTGRLNTIVGANAGHLNTGGGNVFLGSYSGYNETGSNRLYIDNSDTPTPLIWGDFSTDIAAVNGRLGVGAQPGSAYQLHILDERATGRAVYAEATGEDGIGAWGRAMGDGGIGIYGTGSGSGAYFKDADASGLAFVGYGNRGIWAKGTLTGGTFSSPDDTTYWADVATSTYKIHGTGTVSFVQNHPYDENTVIVYAAPEGDEVAVYTRGTARLVNGEARVFLGETFQYVANPDVGLTAHVTPRGDAPVPLSVSSLSTSEMIVNGPAGSDGAFDYIVYGLRLGFEEAAVLQPKERDALLPTAAAIEEGYGDRPDLRAFNAMARHREMHAAIAPGEDIDLSRTRELVAALEDQRPAALARAAARQEGMQANRETDREDLLQPSSAGPANVASTESNASDALAVRALIAELRTEIDDLRSKLAAIEAGK